MDQSGYLEPRQYNVSIGMQLQGKGSASGLLATTAVPVEIPEQENPRRSHRDPGGCGEDSAGGT